MTTLSIIAPVYNEEKVIAEFHKRLTNVLDNLDADAEVIYINDGSKDNSLVILQHLRDSDPRVGIVNFSRNFGKEFAMTAGINHATGEALIVIDSDLQDPPELIPAMVDKWREGFEVVLMKRAKRQGETFTKKFTASLFYKLIKRMSYIHIPENVGDFRLMSRKVIEALSCCNEEVRFMKGLFAWLGFKTATIDYERDVRAGGASAFTYWRLWNFALDGLTGFSTAPLKIASYIGLITLLFSIIYGIVQLFSSHPAEYAVVIFCVTLLCSVQLIVLGIIGEYLARLAIESKRRPLYIIDKFFEPRKK